MARKSVSKIKKRYGGSSAFISHGLLRYRIRHPITELRDFKLNMKYAIQRIRRGWCDKDTFDLDIWFLNVIIPMLQYFRDHLHSYPLFLDGVEYTNKDWEKILDRMIECFEEVNKDADYFCTIEKTEAAKDEAFRLFSKYFWNLWD